MRHKPDTRYATDMILRMRFGMLTQERLRVKARAMAPVTVARMAIARANDHEVSKSEEALHLVQVPVES